MADIPTYSGRGIGEALTKPSGERVVRAQENMLNNILEAEKFKYTETRKAQDKFLENIKIQPKYVISNEARIRQAKMLKDFNDKWVTVSKQHKGIIPFEKQVEMQNDRGMLEAEQQRQLSEMGQWALMDEAVRNHPELYDDKRWFEETQKYQQTGDFNLKQPPLRSMDFGTYLTAESSKFKNEYPGKITQRNGRVFTETVNVPSTKEGNIDENYITDFIKTRVFKNPQSRQDVVEKFMALPTDQKAPYLLDLNKDQVVDNKDIDDNAIIRWAVQNPSFREAVIGRKLTETNVPRPRVATETTPQSSVGGSMIKMTAGKQDFKMPKSYGATEYDKTGNITKTARTYSPKSFHFGGNTPINGVPTRNGVALTENWTEDQLASGMINANIRLYDPVKKVFLVESSSPSESVGQISRTLFEIPQENILDFENVPIKTDITGVNTIGTYNEYWSSSATPRENTTSVKKGELDDLGIK